MSSKTDKKKALVPRLRFPEFRDAGPWKVKRLGEVANDFLDGDWIESKDQSDSGIRLVQTGNIGVGKFVPKPDKARYISEETFKKLRCTEIYPGDCLISRLPDPAGRACLLPDIGERMITAVDCTIVRFNKDEIIPYFFILLSQTKAYLLEAESHGSGSTRKRISRDNLSKIKLPLPSLPEQQKIADCLSSLDEVIELEAKRLEALKAHKKGLMQQLFPREGETTPRLRFPEFRDAGPWKVKRLGEIGPVSMCKRVLKKQTSEVGDIPFYKIGTFGKKPDAYISKELYEKYKETHPFPSKGDILISASGTIGRTVVYDGEPAYFQDSNIVWIANDENIVLNIFLQYCYKRIKWQTDDNTISRLYNDNLRKMKIVVPSIPEQQKIAACLSSLDEVIELQTQKLDALKAHKKGLMQQLFPQEVG